MNLILVISTFLVSVVCGQADQMDNFLAHLRNNADYSGFVYPSFDASLDLRKATTQFTAACPDDAVVFRSQDAKNNVIARVFDPSLPLDKGCIELRLTQGAGGKMPMIEAASFVTLDVRIGLAKTLTEQATFGELQPGLIQDQDHGGSRNFITKISELLKQRASLAGNEEGIRHQEAYRLTKKGARAEFRSTDRDGARPGMAFGLDFEIKPKDGGWIITDIRIVKI